VLGLLFIFYLQVFVPYEDMFQNRLETLNEWMLLMICYHLVLLAGLTETPQEKDFIGWSLILTIVVVIFYNIAIMCYISLR
jgi:hypothetical protein